jgi:hypothetical protein
LTTKCNGGITAKVEAQRSVESKMSLKILS